MHLITEATQTISSEQQSHQTQLDELQKLITQTEVFSERLIDERLYAPAAKELAPFAQAFAHKGGISVKESASIGLDWHNNKPYLNLKWEVQLPPGERQELFDLFLGCINERTTLTAEHAFHLATYRVGKIELDVTIRCKLPSAYRDLLREMGILRTETTGTAYESLSCSYLARQ